MCAIKVEYSWALLAFMMDSRVPVPRGYWSIWEGDIGGLRGGGLQPYNMIAIAPSDRLVVY